MKDAYFRAWTTVLTLWVAAVLWLCPVGAMAMVAVGETPEYVLNTLDGETIHSSSLRGKIVILNLWAASDGTSVETAPELVAIYKKYAGDDVVMFGLPTDRDSRRVKDEAAKLGFIWPQVVDQPGRNAPLTVRLGATTLPMVFIMDPTGTVYWKGHPQVMEKPLTELIAHVSANEKKPDAPADDTVTIQVTGPEAESKPASKPAAPSTQKIKPPGELQPVSPAQMGQWVIKTINSASTGFVQGPETPPIGAGSLSISTGAGNGQGKGGKVWIGTEEWNGRLFTDIEEIRYSFYVTKAADKNIAPYINVHLDHNNNGKWDGVAGGDMILVFDPTLQPAPNGSNPITPNTWANGVNDAITHVITRNLGGWWIVQHEDIAGRNGNSLSLEDLFIKVGNHAIIPNTIDKVPAIVLVVGNINGGNSANFECYIDHITIDRNYRAATTYDFEPAAAASNAVANPAKKSPKPSVKPKPAPATPKTASKPAAKPIAAPPHAAAEESEEASDEEEVDAADPNASTVGSGNTMAEEADSAEGMTFEDEAFVAEPRPGLAAFLGLLLLLGLGWFAFLVFRMVQLKQVIQ